MNGIEKIIGRITVEAEEAAAAVIAEAEKTAEDIRAGYRAKAEEAYTSRMNAGTEEIRLRSERAERAVKLDGRKDTLALKRGILTEAYARAEDKILAMPAEKYTDFLARQIGKAAVSGHESIILNPRDHASFGEAVVKAANGILAARGLPAGLTLSDETRDFSGGVILKEGAVEVNGTVDSLLEQSRNALDAEIAGMLFS